MSTPGISLGLSTQPVAAGPSSIRWPYVLPDAVRVGAASWSSVQTPRSVVPRPDTTAACRSTARRLFSAANFRAAVVERLGASNRRIVERIEMQRDKDRGVDRVGAQRPRDEV